jgi:hypothetical protein
MTEPCIKIEKCDLDFKDAKTGESYHMSERLACSHPLVKRVFYIGGRTRSAGVDEILVLHLDGGYWVEFNEENKLEKANEWLSKIRILTN